MTRAAVYGALVPANQFRPQDGPEEWQDSPARANSPANPTATTRPARGAMMGPGCPFKIRL